VRTGNQKKNGKLETVLLTDIAGRSSPIRRA
jgi:hypothetical protein